MFSIGNAKVRAILVACGGDLSMSAAEDPHVGTEPLTSGWSPKQEEDHVEWLLPKPTLAMQYVLQNAPAGQADQVLAGLESFALRVPDLGRKSIIDRIFAERDLHKSCGAKVNNLRKPEKSVMVMWAPMRLNILLVLCRHVWHGVSGSTKMIRQEDALPGRPQPLEVSATHYVLGTPMKGPWPAGTSKLVFANGCFWGSEKGIWRLPAGIFSTAVGYAAGFTPNPTYEEVVTGRTGHAEAVQVVFDPAKIDLVDILRWFWEAHDPTQHMGQGNDIGTQYRSGLYYFDEDQKELFLASKRAYQAALQAAGIHREVSTEIRDASDFSDGVFYYAEDYHQQYLAKPGARPYCSAQPQQVSLPPFFEWATPSLRAKFGPRLPETFWKMHSPKPHSVVRSLDSPIEWSQFTARTEL
ncbi:msrA2 [Symbiodinium natans]|uniref:peptide-methionine (S)-S-oxide reductase n=1 Tax=Symbiodinium natans TaxID=878477 RepID=A0A812V2P7_9DINO|nr:msrA2 [Symbiodinium natans]